MVEIINELNVEKLRELLKEVERNPEFVSKNK